MNENERETYNATNQFLSLSMENWGSSAVHLSSADLLVKMLFERALTDGSPFDISWIFRAFLTLATLVLSASEAIVLSSVSQLKVLISQI